MRGGLGYARANVAAQRVDGEGWDTPLPIPSFQAEIEETDRAVMALPSELRATVEAVYIAQRSYREIAKRLCVAEPTVHARIHQAHRKLRAWLGEQAEERARRRARDEALQASVRPGFTH
jgi:DNA-directed RNA polymerase specialized sigma24 family protein